MRPHAAAPRPDPTGPRALLPKDNSPAQGRQHPYGASLLTPCAAQYHPVPSGNADHAPVSRPSALDTHGRTRTRRTRETVPFRPSRAAGNGGVDGPVPAPVRARDGDPRASAGRRAPRPPDGPGAGGGTARGDRPVSASVGAGPQVTGLPGRRSEAPGPAVRTPAGAPAGRVPRRPGAFWEGGARPARRPSGASRGVRAHAGRSSRPGASWTGGPWAGHVAGAGPRQPLQEYWSTASEEGR